MTEGGRGVAEEVNIDVADDRFTTKTEMALSLRAGKPKKV